MILEEFEEEVTKFLSPPVTETKISVGINFQTEIMEEMIISYFTGTGRGRGKGRDRNNNYDTCTPRYTNRNYNPLHPDEECRLHGGHL